MNNSALSFTVLLALTLALFSCGADKSTDDATPENKVVAKINGEPIYTSDVNELKSRMLQNVPEDYITPELEEKLLDSLIRSKAMAQSMKKEIDEKTEEIIEKQVTAFREDLLVRAYVEKYGQLRTVTNDQVNQYYTDNPNLFGGGTRKTVEYVEASTVEDREKRVKLLKSLSTMKKSNNWSKSVNRLKTKGFELSYNKLTANEKHIKSPLKEAITKLDKKSEPQLISDAGIYLVRVLDTEKIPPKPLAQVSADVRALLQRQSYRESIETLSDQVMQKSKVQIINASSNGK